MPCDSRITIKIELDAARIDVLAAAMKALGYEQKVSGTWWAPGTVVSLNGHNLEISAGRDVEAIRSEIMRATSREIVQRAAARNGWRLTWTAAGKAQAQRATYGTGR